MFVVAPLGVIAERWRRATDVNLIREFRRPLREAIEFTFRKHGGLHCRDEFRELADVHAHRMPTERHRFD